MPYSEAQKRAIYKYMAEKTDLIQIRVPRGVKSRWKDAAAEKGVSVTSYVHDAVDAQIATDQDGQQIPEGLLSDLIAWLKDRGHTDAEIVDCLEHLGQKMD